MGTLLFGICCLSSNAISDPLIFMPFEYRDYWYCPQGQNSDYTHLGKLAYGIDFNQGSGPNNVYNEAFGENLYSPVNGEIVEIRDGIMDFQNNSGPNKPNNYGWGNTIVILDQDGQYYVRFAHLKYLSTTHLSVGDQVDMRDYIGQVGQTGTSTGPHLHIQVMRKTHEPSPNATYINERTSPFTFAEGVVETDEWLRSALGYNVSLLDNNGEKSLSNDFEVAYTYYNSREWITKLGTYGYAGKGFRRKYTSWYNNNNARFNWAFSVKESGIYFIFVTYEDAANNDPSAEYYLDGQKVRVLTQKNGGNDAHFYKYVTIRYFSAHTLHTLSVQGTTPGTYVIADAVVLRRLG